MQSATIAPGQSSHDYAKSIGQNAYPIIQDDDFIVKPTENNIPPHPAGSHQAVIVDLRDMGEHEEEYKGIKKKVKKIQITYMTKETIHVEKLDPDAADHPLEGKRYVLNKWYTNSMADQSNLRKLLKKIRGRDLIGEEVSKGVNLARALIGVNVMLTVVSEPSQRTGEMVSYISDVAPWNTNFGPNIEADPGFVRWKDKPRDAQGNIIKDSAAAQANPVDQKADAINRLQNLFETAKGYGLKPPDVDLNGFALADINKAIKQWGDKIDTAMAQKSSDDDESDPFAGDPEETPVAPAPVRDRKAANNAAAMQSDETLKLSKTLEEKRAAALEGNEEEEKAFVQSVADTISKMAEASGGKALSDGQKELVNVMADAFPQLPLEIFLTNAVTLETFNEYLEAKEKKTVESLDKLTTPSCRLLIDGIKKGNIIL